MILYVFMLCALAINSDCGFPENTFPGTELFKAYDCEPDINQFTNFNRWSRIFNVALSPMGWISGPTAKSKEIISYRKADEFEREVGLNNVHRYFSGVDLYKINYTGPMSRLFNTLVFNFIHGDSFIVHLFDENKMKYSKHELGFHTKKFALVVPPGVWFAVDVDMHRENLYTLAGWSFIYTGKNTTFPIAKKSELIKKFPKHAELITKLTE